MIVDLFAGPGGWDEGAKAIGLADVTGIEWDAAACATAEAAGHKRLQADVSTIDPHQFSDVKGVIGSPPCTTFSMSGHGGGRLLMALLHSALGETARGEDTLGRRRDEATKTLADWVVTGMPDLLAGERQDWARKQATTSLLVVEPLRFVRALRPQWVALEQVPAVLPLWKRIAQLLRDMGYSAWCGILNSADYGVPQTRQRAVLVAHRTRSAHAPVPTHAQNPRGEDLFGGELLPWVSMATALGWQGVDLPARTVCGNRSPRWTYDQANSTATGWTLVGSHRAKTNDRTKPRGLDQPAPTVAFGHSDMRWVAQDKDQGDDALSDWVLNTNRDQRPDGTRQTVPTSKPAPTLTAKSGGQWTLGRPATTVADDPRISAPGHRDRAGGERQHADSLKITVTEAAVLQSFRPDYPWQGNKTKQFEQVGNAVPPLLAAHVLSALTGRPIADSTEERAA